jgi:hypothetical protein
MIVELRSYRLKSGTYPAVESAYAAAMPARVKFSPLGGFWRSIIGPIDKILHAWPYKDLSERGHVRHDSVKDGSWPPPVAGSLYEQETAIMIPTAFSPELKPQKLGPIYEICTDTFAPGVLVRKAMPVWKDNIGARTALSPLVACWFTDLGAMNTVVHIWAYSDLTHMQSVKVQAAKSGVWPIKTTPDLAPLKQDSLVAVPLPFSPLQ